MIREQQQSESERAFNRSSPGLDSARRMFDRYHDDLVDAKGFKAGIVVGALKSEVMWAWPTTRQTQNMY